MIGKCASKNLLVIETRVNLIAGSPESSGDRAVELVGVQLQSPNLPLDVLVAPTALRKKTM